MTSERGSESSSSITPRCSREPARVFLDGACAGDESLRQEVESLLAQAQSAEGFLAHPPGGSGEGVAEDAPRL